MAEARSEPRREANARRSNEPAADAPQPGARIEARGDGRCNQKAITERHDVAAPHPIAELLACPPAVGNMLNASAGVHRV